MRNFVTLSHSKHESSYPIMYRLSDIGHSTFFSIPLFSVVYVFGTHFVYINNVNNAPVRF